MQIRSGLLLFFYHFPVNTSFFCIYINKTFFFNDYSFSLRFFVFLSLSRLQSRSPLLFVFDDPAKQMTTQSYRVEFLYALWGRERGGEGEWGEEGGGIECSNITLGKQKILTRGWLHRYVWWGSLDDYMVTKKRVRFNR